jgi:cation diffusion facilitator CzcD-associated flavoprotein CzcO
MKLRAHDWPSQTPDFVTHDVLATYIQDTAAANDVLSNISFKTRVDKAEKKGSKWEVQSSRLVDGEIKRAVQVSLATDR